MVGLVGLVLLFVALLIIWVVVSLPVYAAAKVVTSGKATLGEAMVATLGGGIIYVVVFVAVSFVLGTVLGYWASLVAILLAFLAWLAVYKASFETGWLGAVAIAILAAVIVVVVDIILVALFGVALPKFFHV